jgi:Tfp pilus assembly protein PilN
MFRAPLKIHLMPQQVVLKRPHRWFPNREAETVNVETGINPNEGQSTCAIAACTELLGQEAHSGKLQITFSDLWARYDMIPLGETALSDEEAMLLARGHFSNTYPDTGSAAWPLRLAQKRQQLLISAVNPTLLEALKQMTTSSGNQFVQAQPLFIHVLDQYAHNLSSYDGWMLLDEPGLMIAAYLERGQLLNLRCQRCDGAHENTAQTLLERQAALLSKPAGEVRIFSYSGRPLPLRMPWHSSQFYNLGADLLTPTSPFHKSGISAELNFAIEQHSLVAKRPAWGISLLAVGTLVLGGVTNDYQQQAKINAGLNDLSASMRQHTPGLHSGAAFPANITTEIAQVNAAYALIQTPWENIFRALELARDKAPNNIALLSVRADTAKQEITLTGEAKDFAALSAFTSALSSSPVFQSASLTNDKLSEGVSPLIVTFDLRLAWHEPDAATY